MRFPLFKPPKHTGKYLADVCCSSWYAPGRQNVLFKEELCKFFSTLDPSPRNFVLGSSATALFQALCLHYWYAPDTPIGAVTFDQPTWPGMLSAVRAAGLHFSSMCPALVVQTDIGGAEIRGIDTLYKGKPHLRDASHSWFKDACADYILFSCYPTKLVPGAEGGVLYCKDPEVAALITSRISCGVPSLYGSPGTHRLDNCVNQEVVPAAIKATMPDALAAINREALEKAPSYIAAIGESWEKLFMLAQEMEIPFKPQTLRPYLFQIRAPGSPSWKDKEKRTEALAARADLVARLTDHDIPTAWNFPPSDWITLPCYPGMIKEEVEEILKPVWEWKNAQP